MFSPAELREPHRVAARERGQAEILRECDLANRRWSAEQHVLCGLEERKGVALLDELAIEAARVRPVEAIERGHRAELERARAALEILALALVSLERDQLPGGLDLVDSIARRAEALADRK